MANLAVQAGAAILDIYSRDFSVDFKEDDSPLTEADLASNRTICRGLSALSDLPILSEESKKIPYPERAAWDSFWLVDPLDGTKEFIRRNGEFTVNIALIRQCAPVVGFVYAPVLCKLYCGVVGEGAFRLVLNGLDPVPDIHDFGVPHPAYVRLPCEPPPRNGVLRVVASRSHRNAETNQFIEKLAANHRRVSLVSSGSSLKLCMVAEGTADVYPRLAPTMEWDTAAAQAVVEAAGSHVFQYPAAEPLRYNKRNLLNPSFVVSTLDANIGLL